MELSYQLWQGNHKVKAEPAGHLLAQILLFDGSSVAKTAGRLKAKVVCAMVNACLSTIVHRFQACHGASVSHCVFPHATSKSEFPHSRLAI